MIRPERQGFGALIEVLYGKRPLAHPLHRLARKILGTTVGIALEGGIEKKWSDSALKTF